MEYYSIARKIYPMEQSKSIPRNRSSKLVVARFTNSLAIGSLWVIAGSISALLLLLIGYIFLKGLPAINWEFLTTAPHGIEMEGGIFPTIVSSLYLTVLTVLIATPIGIGGGIYMNEYARENRVSRALRFFEDCLASVPSIVFGLFGIALFVYALGLGWSILSGALTLALMVLPTIFRTSEESLRAVPESYREASLALGATKWETIKKVTLPTALPGIGTGIVLSIGRAFGETAAVLYTAGLAINTPISPLQPGRTMTLHLYLLITQGGSLQSAFGVALLLILLILLFNFGFLSLLNKIGSRFVKVEA